MFELLTTDEFAAWFSTLEAGPAEDVAATLEVIVQLGTRTEAPDSSEMLLWYEHPSVSGRSFEPAWRAPPELVKFTQDWGRFAGYVKRVVKHLDSPAFAARLAQLPPQNAEIAIAAVKRIRRLSWARPTALGEFRAKRGIHFHKAPSAADIQGFARFADLSEVREAYFAALSAAGFEVEDVPPHSAALREISLRSRAPGLRLLYGIDEPRNRGLVVVGEWLDQSFYGDSVRRGEAQWARFLEGVPLATQAAGAR